MRNHRNDLKGRPAFTLIELLIAIAIIAVLAALSASAYFYVMGRQYDKNTNAAIEQIYGVLKHQWDHVIAEATKEAIPEGGNSASNNVRILAAPDPSGERAKVIWIMLRLAEAFPSRYDEIQAPAINAYLPANRRKYSPSYQRKIGALTSSPSRLQSESAACLFLALSTAKGGHALNPEQMPVKPQMNAENLMEFRDAYGHPLAFFRFPSRYPRLAPADPNTIWPKLTGPAGNYHNPLDPMRTLQSGWPAANRTIFENAIRFEVGNWYTTPVIVSAGRDYQMGLQFNNARNFADMSILTGAAGDLDTNNLLDANDNLYSFNIVAP